MSPRAFILVGKSGSGKGTQAELLIDYLKKKDRPVLYMETGKKFREFTKRDTYSSQLTKKVLDEGGLLPAFLPIWVWADSLIENFTGKEDMVFDGLARQINEAPVLDRALKFYGIQNPFVIVINVSDEWATTRLTERGRSDDNDEDIKRRLQWFQDNVVPVIDYFKDKEGYRFIEINGEQTIEQVHKEIIDKIF